jgi:hypothetical protein
MVSLFVAFYDSQGSVSHKSQSHIATDGQSVSQSVSLGVEPHLGPMTRYLLLFDSYGLVIVGRPLWREDGSVFSMCCWPLSAQSLSGPSPLGLATIIYSLRFETSLFVATYDSQSHGGGIHTGLGYSLYILGSDPTKNTVSIVIPTISQLLLISLPRERVYRDAPLFRLSGVMSQYCKSSCWFCTCHMLGPSESWLFNIPKNMTRRIIL